MHTFSRNILLVITGLLVTAGIGLKFANQPLPVSVQALEPTAAIPPGACGDACEVDNDCSSQDFCHATIDWGSWRIQPTHNLERKTVTGYDSYITPDGTSIQYFVSNRQVYRCVSNGNCELHYDIAGKDTIQSNGQTVQNPIVSYNISLMQENGVQVAVYHLVRYREMYSKKVNYHTGAVIQIWERNTDLDSLVASYGDNWNSWVMLGFDSEIAYEDGRTEQRLIIGHVTDKNTLTTNDDVVSESIMLSRISKMNNDGSLTWSGVPFTFAGRTTWNSVTLGLGTTLNDGAQGSVIGFDKSFNPLANKYSQTVIRTYSVGSGQYENAIFIREAEKRANREKQCKPKIYPESCTMPAYTSPPTPTSIPPADIPVAQNFSGQVACNQGEVTFSWTMPTDYEIGHAVFEYCQKTRGDQTTCVNPQRVLVPGLLLDLDQPTKYSRDNALDRFNLTKGQEALVRLRLSPQAVPEINIVGMPTAYASVKYTGPEGDYNNSCAVNITDYVDVVGQLFEEELDHVLTNNWQLFLLNKVIRNFGTSS